jgi:Carboxypeptidase regulatory-like domain/TonB dependent receptor
VRLRFPLPFLTALVLLTTTAICQSPSGTISGLVLDPSGHAIVGADIQIVNDATGVRYPGATNGDGIYAIPNLPPGAYRIQVSKIGFKTLIKPDVVLNVQSAVAINFTLPVGAVSETLTVQGGAPLVNTESAAVSTVVDRQFAENLPLNGRSFQSLIYLSPGVVVTTSNFGDAGQFSVNGQRAAANYWMVDGVGANIGVGVSSVGTVGNGLGGTLGSFSVQGGTNSLVSVDAMQEFRIQTSTYAPEFGRTPGGQISIVTRSGTNRFHGTVFDYLRNDALDASDWFNGYTNTPALPKAKERQNDFGGTFGGPIRKDKTFFFFSYEGLRLRLPQTALTTVPSLAARRNATASMRPYLNSFPLPNGPDNPSDGTAPFNASFSDPATLDAYSLRIDHRISNRVSLFGRVNYSPSKVIQRGLGSALNTLSPTRIGTTTYTVGNTWLISSLAENELRLNYSNVNAELDNSQDRFGGAAPLPSLPFPTPFGTDNSFLRFQITSLQQGKFQVGRFEHNVQRQINLIDNLSAQLGSHALKFGADFRRLTPLFEPVAYAQLAAFPDVPSAQNGLLSSSIVVSNRVATFLFRDLGIYAQDTWHVAPRLVVTYGVRWDVNFVPRSLHGPNFPAVTGFNLNDLSTLAPASAGTPLYRTKYANFAPRFGLAYQIRQTESWQTVVRGGAGMFYDLATSEIGNSIGIGSGYPFGNEVFNSGGSFPLTGDVAAPPPITPPSSRNPQFIYAFDPHLRLPVTVEWNVALEQALGREQTVSASYLGASGRHLLQTAFVLLPNNQELLGADLVANAGSSSYHAFQAQFQRRLSRGLQALASFTWAHSIDTGSAGSAAVLSNVLVPSVNANANRGPSDFDIRHAFSAGFTYDLPARSGHSLVTAILGRWSVQNILQVRSAPPVDVSDGNFFEFNRGFTGDIRPDMVQKQPFYLYGLNCATKRQVPTCPGGKGLNPAAFTDPPTDPGTGNPLRQGNLPRNALRGFGATQWDFAVHREFPLHESMTLQFRAEMFNTLNHPNFGPPNASFGAGGFGLSSKVLSNSLNQNLGGGAFSSLYQIGGPRSIQFALKLVF